MAYTRAEGQQELLDAVAGAIDDIGFALALLGAAYEQLDEKTADELEERLFGPVQRAYGRAKRTHAEFSARSGLSARSFQQRAATSGGARDQVEDALDAIFDGDQALAALQDSLLPIEVGDVNLRAQLAEVRAALGGVPTQAENLLRHLGR